MIIVIWFVLGVVFFLFTITAIHVCNPQLNRESEDTEKFPTFV